MKMNDYFEIISSNKNVLHFKLKNFWSDEVCDTIGKDMAQSLKAAVDNFRGERFIILSEQNENFKPVSPKAKVMMTDNMAYCQKKGVIRGVDVITSAITRLAMKDAEEKAGEGQFREIVETLDEGLNRVEELKKELNL